jgi:hypothetical protein
MKIIGIVMLLFILKSDPLDNYLLKSKKLLENSKYELIKNELDCRFLYIVLPEYLTYSQNQDLAEITFVKLLDLFGSVSAKDISVGPFQMTSSFILKNITMTKLYPNDTNFINVRNHGIKYIFSNINVFTELNFQIKILKCFITLHNFQSVSFRKKLTKYMYTYNTGKQIDKNTDFEFPIFSKIDFRELSYVNWGLFFFDREYLGIDNYKKN